MHSSIIIPEYDILVNHEVKDPELYFREVIMAEFNKDTVITITGYRMIKFETKSTEVEL